MTWRPPSWNHPKLVALLNRAEAYRKQVLAQYGTLPERFLVTDEEIELLYDQYRQSHPSPPYSTSYHLPWMDTEDVPLRLLGMDVVTPDYVAWHPGALKMLHIRLPEGLRCPRSADDSVTFNLVQCETPMPSPPVPEVVCPCGEVIWVLQLPPQIRPAVPYRPRIPPVDSERSSDGDWEAAVHDLVAQVQARQAARHEKKS